MAAHFSLAEMNLEEKLEAMDLLWADLSDRPDQVDSPSWHRNE